MLKEAIEIVSVTNNAKLILIVIFVIAALVLGMPAILKRSLKGILLALFCSIFAALGTYILLF